MLLLMMMMQYSFPIRFANRQIRDGFIRGWWSVKDLNFTPPQGGSTPTHSILYSITYKTTCACIFFSYFLLIIWGFLNFSVIILRGLPHKYYVIGHGGRGFFLQKSYFEWHGRRGKKVNEFFIVFLNRWRALLIF